MNTLRKKIRTAFLIVGIAMGVMFGSTQQSKAQYYDNYYSYYLYYINVYESSGNIAYYYIASAFYYYYLGGYYGDYYGYYYDSYGFKSDRHLSGAYYSSFTYAANYSNLYFFYGDYYSRL